MSRDIILCFQFVSEQQNCHCHSNNIHENSGVVFTIISQFAASLQNTRLRDFEVCFFPGERAFLSPIFLIWWPHTLSKILQFYYEIEGYYAWPFGDCCKNKLQNCWVEARRTEYKNILFRLLMLCSYKIW